MGGSGGRRERVEEETFSPSFISEFRPDLKGRGDSQSAGHMLEANSDESGVVFGNGRHIWSDERVVEEGEQRK